MEKQKIIRIIVTFVAALFIIYGYAANADAKSSGRSPGGSWHHNPAPSTVPPQVPSWFPHGFPYEWSTGDVMNVFNENGLGIRDSSLVTEMNHGELPSSVNEVRKFSVPLSGEDAEGYIMSFKLKDNLEKIKKYYHERNENGELYTWTFVKGNVLLVLPGTLAEDSAGQFRDALINLKIE